MNNVYSTVLPKYVAAIALRPGSPTTRVLRRRTNNTVIYTLSHIQSHIYRSLLISNIAVISVAMTTGCPPTCDGRCLGLLLRDDGVTKVTQVLQAALDIQVGGQPGHRETQRSEWKLSYTVRNTVLGVHSDFNSLDTTVSNTQSVHLSCQIKSFLSHTHGLT